MIGRDDDGVVRQRGRGAVGEARPLPRGEPLPPPRGLEPAFVRDPAERHHHPHPGQEPHFGREIRPAALQFAAARLVGRRGAARGRADVAVRKHEPVVARDGVRLAREAVAVQRRVQPGAARVAGEHPAGAVRAMRRRREADDEQPRPRVPEPGYGLPPVGPVLELALFVSRHPAAVSAQPRAARARDDDAAHIRDRGVH